MMRIARTAAALVLWGWAIRAGAQPADSVHRAEQDREITYWLLDPARHQFRFAHDFNITRPGQTVAHSFVRAGSTVSEDITFIDLDSGRRLKTRKISGAAVNALELYPEPSEPDSVVVEGALLEPVPEGGSVRIRVIETYTDTERYRLQDGKLVWDRTLGRPRNTVMLPQGWMLTHCSTPASVSEDAQGRIVLRLDNPRNDELHVVVRARRRPVSQSGRGDQGSSGF
ncbi:MAG TPA: hypothetical protein VGB99_07220 [Acidobacteriota bacterium]